MFLDGGTTAIQIARYLDSGLSVAVMTQSPEVAVEFAADPRSEFVMLGTRSLRLSMVNTGAALFAAALKLRANLDFMGVTGVHPKTGLSTGDAEEAAVKRAFHERAAEAIALASCEKLPAASPLAVTALSRLRQSSFRPRRRVTSSAQSSRAASRGSTSGKAGREPPRGTRHLAERSAGGRRIHAHHEISGVMRSGTDGFPIRTAPTHPGPPWPSGRGRGYRTAPSPRAEAPEPRRWSFREGLFSRDPARPSGAPMLPRGIAAARYERRADRHEVL